MTATAEVSRLIPAAATKIWEALTSPEGMKAYMFGAEVTTDWRIGGPIRIDGEFNGKRFEDRGEVRAFDPPRRLSYTHWSAASGAPDTPENRRLVTFELNPRGRQTEVSVRQENLDGVVRPGDVAHRRQYEATWSAMLEALERVAVGRP